MCNDIEVSGTEPTFHLRFGPSSYIISVLDDRFVTHRYWGPRLDPRDSEPGTSEMLGALSEADGRPNTAEYLTAISLYGSGAGDRARVAPDLLPREYPSWGTGELGSPAWIVRRDDGTRAGALEYRGYTLLRGADTRAERACPRDLPWIQPDDAAEITTLRIDCADPAGGTEIALFYTVVEEIPVLLRWTRITNHGGQPMVLEAAASASVDLPLGAENTHLITLNGAWSRERVLHRRPVAPGIQQVESRGGASGHQHAPFIALADADATEHRGRVRGLSLLYSGNHRHSVEVDQYGVVRAQAGINPFAFSWHLASGASFDTPACILAFSPDGLNGLSATLHRFVRNVLLPPVWRDRDRPIVLNTWEAHYFGVNAENVAELARHGAGVGAELLVLDDGWYRGRNDDTSSLGDWVPDREKFPHGLLPVAEAVRREGLGFGIWVEPEMVSPESDLFRAHPEWTLQIPGREATRARNQLVLDLANPAVVDFLTQTFTELLESAPIEYVKWDMNRNMSEPGSTVLPPEQQGEVMHRYILGLYRLLDTLTRRFPDVLFEGCAGGGGRFDYGMLAWTPQFWTSDQTDAIERLSIQRGSSLLFPPETMGAHVSAAPNHQLGRMTPPETRAATALVFNYGYELDLSRATSGDRATYRFFSDLYRRNRRLFRTGRFVRLAPDGATGTRNVEDAPPAGEGRFAWMVVSPAEEQIVVVYVQTLARANRRGSCIRLRDIPADARYEIRVAGTEREFPVTWATGAVLTGYGLPIPALNGDFRSIVWELVRRSD